MPAVSKKQQRFFGMVRAAQKGEMKNPSKEVSDVAGDISMKDAKKFAKTKHKGLPEVKESVLDVVRKYAKKKEEKQPQKAMDAGARAKRKLARREYRSKVGAIVPKELEDQKNWLDFTSHFHI
tara:strand:+ start:120 stop:488 length:369 start_codon:yes stop_codon:yes gene_type:complete